MIFYGLKSCDSCKKALKALAAAGKEVEIRDVREDGLDKAAVEDWVVKAGVDVLINRRSTTWRGLSAEDQAKAMTEAGAVAAVLASPTLMKRPVIIDGDAVHVGWSKATEAALI